MAGLTDFKEVYNIISMNSCRNNENNRRFNEEISRLSKGFEALNTGHKEGVLKTAQGLLRIQMMHKKTAAGNGIK